MDEQRRRLHVLRVFQRAVLPELCVVGIEVRLVLIADEVVTDVRESVEAQPVRDRALRRAGTEPVGVSNDPVRHEPAVTAARFAYTVRIDRGIAAQDLVRKVHEVLIIRLAVVSHDVRKGVSPAVRALRVAEEHKVAHACPKLHLMIEHRAVNRLRSAVNVEHRGIFLARIVVLRLEHPAVDLPAFAFRRDRLALRDILVLQRIVVEMRQLFEFARLQILCVKLL